MESTSMLRVYVACLASYGSGRLHGRWVECHDEDQIRNEIAAMLRESPYPNTLVDCPDCHGEDAGCQTCSGQGKVASAEEWAVHDYECDLGRIRMGEHPDIENLCQLAEALDEHGAAFLAFYDNESGHDVDTDRFLEAYRGSWQSLEEYAEQLLDDMGVFNGIPDILRNYFDVEKFAHDLELGGDIWTTDNPEGGLFVFDNH